MVRIQILRSYENTGEYRSFGRTYFLFFQAVRTETAVNMDKARTGVKYGTYSYDITAHKTVLTNVANHFKIIADIKVVEFPAV